MKVIGYFTSWNEEIKIENLKYKYLTHINYAFLIPKSDGSIINLDKVKVTKLINYAHKNNVKVYISVGGWCYEEEKLDTTFEKICDNKDILDLFINNIIKVVRDFNFDGVDMDWEYPTEKYIKQYEYMLFNLKESLHKENKGLSIAIPPGINVDGSINNVSAITDKVLDIVDWINLMVYDNTKEQNHSSYKYAEISLEYWINTRNYNKDKIILGVPFYTRPTNLLYSYIVECNKENYNYDSYASEFYNGIPMIKKKTKLAKEKCSGIMIWALNYDTLDKYSLLKTINDEINY